MYFRIPCSIFLLLSGSSVNLSTTKFEYLLILKFIIHRFSKKKFCTETRLNSPWHNLISKMAVENICADVRLDDFTVELKPEDIPGASVNDKDIGKLNVNQLKFWLRCRRVKQGGNKKELFGR